MALAVEKVTQPTSPSKSRADGAQGPSSPYFINGKQADEMAEALRRHIGDNQPTPFDLAQLHAFTERIAASLRQAISEPERGALYRALGKARWACGYIDAGRDAHFQAFLRDASMAEEVQHLGPNIAKELAEDRMTVDGLSQRLRRFPDDFGTAQVFSALAQSCAARSPKLSFGDVEARELLVEGVRRCPTDTGLNQALRAVFKRSASRKSREDLFWENQNKLNESKIQRLQTFIAEAEKADRWSYFEGHMAIYKMAAIGVVCGFAVGALIGAVYGVEQWVEMKEISESGVVVSWDELITDKSLASVLKVAGRYGMVIGGFSLFVIIPLAIYDAYHLWYSSGGTA